MRRHLLDIFARVLRLFLHPWGAGDQDARHGHQQQETSQAGRSLDKRGCILRACANAATYNTHEQTHYHASHPADRTWGSVPLPLTMAKKGRVLPILPAALLDASARALDRSGPSTLRAVCDHALLLRSPLITPTYIQEVRHNWR